MNYDFYGYDRDFLQKYQKAVQTTTVADVMKAARRNIHPDQLEVTVVGNDAAFDAPLSELGMGDVSVLDITIPKPEVEQVEATQDSLARGSQILARMRKAHGGDKLSELKAFSVDGTMHLTLGPGREMDLTVSSSIRVSSPGTLHAIDTPAGKAKQGFDGKVQWAQQGPQIQEVPGGGEKALEDWRRYLLVILTNSDVSLQYLRSEKQNDVVRVNYEGLEGYLMDLWVDSSGKVVHGEYDGEHPFTRAPGKFTTNYSDYRESDGIFMPHKQEVQFEGKPFQVYTYNSSTMNPELAEGFADKPEM
jgi:hypothetical protein